MLDQSFSAENFRTILDIENRKGRYLEGHFFPKFKELTEEIKQCNEEIRIKRRELGKDEDALQELYEKRETLKKAKEDQLSDELRKISEKVITRSFEIELKRIDIPDDKPIYTVSDIPEHFFAMKQIQKNVSRLFDVKQANRSAIVSQVKMLLDDEFPKFVLRTDIEDFYESIPHERILEKINEENLLTPFSRKLLRRILEQYKAKSGADKGIPRGIGVSAYIAELYMRDIDRAIKALRDVTYYARYVDDIVIIFTPHPHEHSRDYVNDVRDIVEKKHNLKLKDAKTEPFDLRAQKHNFKLEYLGYAIAFGNGEVKVSMTRKKCQKYRQRLDLAFSAYKTHGKASEKMAQKLLVKRLRFLTGNTRLINNKKNILIGIYYSNSQLTEQGDLIALDAYLRHKIDSLINSQLKERLLKYSFLKGYEMRRFSPFKPQELSKLMEIWGKR